MAEVALDFHSGWVYNITLNTTTPLLEAVHFNYPWVLIIVFLTAFLVNSIRSSDSSRPLLSQTITGPGGNPLPAKVRKSKLERERLARLGFSPVRKAVFKYITVGVLFTFAATCANTTLHAIAERENGWWCGEATVIYVIAGGFFHSILLVALFDSSSAPAYPHQVAWILSLTGELVLLVATAITYSSPHEDVNSLKKGEKDIIDEPTDWEIIEITIDAIRTVLVVLLVGLYTLFSIEHYYIVRNSRRGSEDETSSLLGHGQISNNGTISDGVEGYGSSVAPFRLGTVGNNDAATDHHSTDAEDNTPAFYKSVDIPSKNWWDYLKSYSLFFPYLWPGNSLKLQLVVFACFLLVICQRFVNLAVPWQIGVITNQLSGKDGYEGMPWRSISFLIVLKFLQGSSGVLGAARSVLWIPISQYSYQALTTASFEHVHGLSLDFHLGKRTGEVLSALSKGDAINGFLESITFNVLPMLVDLVVAVVYFGILFDAYYALIIGIVTFSYLYLTIRMARWRSRQRRLMSNLSREESAVKNDSLTSYESVKYFNAETFEFKRYRETVSAFQFMEYQVTISLNILNISQTALFMVGHLCTGFLMAWQVTTGEREVGDFVTLLTYMAQLQQPLNFFGTFYRSMQSAMINGERLLELFKERPTVVDVPSARSMPTCKGEIRFDNVKFAYDARKPALENLSFTCAPGTTTAFVGESGGGKSTVFKLMYRFYNAEAGYIYIDGNDIQDVTIDSVRRHIGVVPQDTVLFNETLMWNLRYANQDATDAEIHAACRAASIHDKIMGFPDKYDTKVGERGLRLSGGEKQRVAIARTILKNPRIIMLDEATAALDSDTEQNIQEALQTLSKGRTMLVIAHRLSTITSADQILVLHAGQVAEAGTHLELLDLKGRYSNMWKKQIRAQKAADVAAQALAKAKALQASATKRPTSSGEEAISSGETSDNEMETPGFDGTTGRAAEGSQDTDSTLDGSQDESTGAVDNKSSDNDSTPRNTPRNAT
ncbi:putative heavy metal tolerance protein [Calycina marina]|uniref:Heavy metal tolerance protein n=1 Tax=Calycina marina TaxID=1763456 RepID=A0A9P7Z0D6_9HELO|nr:putative heavy metal tolerance protein [Calycina marina]